MTAVAPLPSSACGDCPDPIPECQEGEALTVDRNTTELCCPLYQCGESQLEAGMQPQGAPGTFMCPFTRPSLRTNGSSIGSHREPQGEEEPNL